MFYARGVALVLALVVCVLLGATASVWAGGGATPGTSHKNCVTTEPTLDAAATTIMCDDFERTRSLANAVTTFTGSNPGTWVVTNCDNPAGAGGESHPPNKGWCAALSLNTSDAAATGKTDCGGLGANGTACAARSNPSGGGSNEALATHNFAGTCVSGGFGTSIINGVCHYSEVYARWMAWHSPGYVFGSEKFITITTCCTGTAGILIGGLGIPDGNTNLGMCPVADCNALDFHNPQTNGFGHLCNPNCIYIGQNAGNGVIDLSDQRGRWTAVEIRIRLNSAPNVQDGLYQIWVDDCGVNGTTCPATPTLRGNYTNIRWIGTAGAINNATARIGAFFIDRWGNPAGNGTIRMDQVVVSTQRIGWMGAAVGPGNTNAQAFVGTAALASAAPARVIGTVLKTQTGVRALLLLAPLAIMLVYALIWIRTKARSR